MSDTKKLDLLPAGAFVINKQDGTKVQGRFSMYMLDRFCESLKVDSYLVMYNKLLKGAKLHEYATLIQMAIEDYHRSDFKAAGLSVEKVMDEIIDSALGGISTEDFDALIGHAMGRIMNWDKVAKQLTDKVSEEEKKSESKSSSTDGSLESNVLKPE